MTNTTATTEHAEFLSLVPALEIRACIRFRYLNPVDRDDAVADAIAYAYGSFLRLKKRGKDPTDFPAAFTKFVVMAVARGRAIGRKFTSRDVLSAHAQRRHSVTVHRIDDGISNGGGWWRDLIIDLRTNVADQAAFNVDFCEWIDTLSTVKQNVTKLLAEGHATAETAELAAVSPGRVSQLRRELAASWTDFQGDR
jgi:hypothetical protein